MNLSHIFGPVHSRRLGRSLGVDLVPMKTCSFDCVYCECGQTSHLSYQREVFFPVSEVIKDLDQYLSTTPKLDYITFAGSGEPTLSLSIGSVIAYLKDTYPRYKVAVLTNSSRISDPDIRSELSRADLVIPTLSSVRKETFARINRPAPEVSLPRIIDGLITFRSIYSGEIWLEIFVIPGINTTEEELIRLRNVIIRIQPDKVQLNTLDRPGTERWVEPVPAGMMRKIQKILNLPYVEVID